VTISRNESEADLLETVTLAHFSVKEYLVSDRVRTSPANYFAMSYSAGHYFIAESCILYILHYADSTAKDEAKDESKVSRLHRLHLKRLPLLAYASNSWFAHINMLQLDQQKLLTPLVLKLLLSEDVLSSRRYVSRITSSIGIDKAPNLPPFGLRTADPLNNESSLGLFEVVKELLASGRTRTFRHDILHFTRQ
jgi:hypothetical protein